jgi:hypothetical protein
LALLVDAGLWIFLLHAETRFSGKRSLVGYVNGAAIRVRRFRVTKRVKVTFVN